ncbi:MAG: RES domain-containing protein [Chloroflexota bacterium]|nr:RES domain-containing protein [Chloroflexota bacterium]
MAARLVTIGPPPTGIYRLSHRPADPFAPPDWQYALEDGTFGNRFDDPRAEQGVPLAARFRTIYCATQRVGTFGETLARFRLSLPLVAQLEAVEDEEPIEESLIGALDPDDHRRGLIAADWRHHRHVGHTYLDPSLRFVDIVAGASMQALREPLAPVATDLGISEIDLSSVTSQQRRFTQFCAQYIHDEVDEAGQPALAGIRYLSRLNPEWECWAIFDDRIRHEPGFPAPPESIFPDDRDLETVAHLFDLTIEIMPGHGQYSRP